MEKIAQFFGVPTSRLVGSSDYIDAPVPDDQPHTTEARILAKGIDKLPQEQREQALSVIRAMFAKYAEYFEKETNDHDA